MRASSCRRFSLLAAFVSLFGSDFLKAEGDIFFSCLNAFEKTSGSV